MKIFKISQNKEYFMNLLGIPEEISKEVNYPHL